MGLAVQGGRLGKPLRFLDIEGAVSGTNASMSWAQMLSSGGQYNDQILYCFVAEMVQEGLRRIMADMTPEDLGYDTIHPDKIGTDRATRRAAIVALEARLAALRVKEGDLAEKLLALGAPVRAA